MSPAHFDYRKAVQVILSVAAGYVFLMAMHASVRAEPVMTQTFVVPSDDGYGIHECLTPGTSCGQVVADAWCEAHGLDKSVAYGPAEDITASTGAPVTHVEPGSLIITCKE